MTISPSVRCYAVGCASDEVRRCYLCPNVCCADHGTINASGTICGECSDREQAKRMEATKAQQAAPNASGCLVALVASLSVPAWPVMRLLRATPRQRVDCG